MAGLSDPDYSIYVRIDPDGRRLTERADHHPGWLTRTLDPNWPARVWLETAARPSAAEEMVIVRLAQGSRLVLERTRGRLRKLDEGAVEVLLDAAAPIDQRMHSAATLGFTEHDQVRALAVPDYSAPGKAGRLVVKPLIHRLGSERYTGFGRMGIGVAGGILDLPDSFRTAVAALRFTTDGHGGETGPAHISADAMGGLLVFAEHDDIRQRPVRDVMVLDKAAAQYPDLLATLDAFVMHASARAAADALHLHHSTMQLRLQQAEKLLGWRLNNAPGRFRAQLAMALRLIQRDEL